MLIGAKLSRRENLHLAFDEPREALCSLIAPGFFVRLDRVVQPVQPLFQDLADQLIPTAGVGY